MGRCAPNSPVLMRSHVGGIAALRNYAGIGPFRAVRVELIATISLVIILALPTVEAGEGLGTDADALAGFDECHLRADAECRADDFWEGKCVSILATDGREKYSGSDHAVDTHHGLLSGGNSGRPNRP